MKNSVANIAFFTILLMVISVTCRATYAHALNKNEILEHIRTADVMALKKLKNKNCLIVAYLNAIELKKAPECQSEDKIEQYLIFQSQYFRNLFQADYLQAIENLTSIQTLIKENDELFKHQTDIKKTARQNLQMLKPYSSNEFRYSKSITLSLHSDFTLFIDENEYLLDSAAMFSTSPLKNTLPKTDIRSVSNAVRPLSYSIKLVDGYELIVFDSDTLVLGQQFFLRFEKIVIERSKVEERPISSFKLFYDTGNLFFIAPYKNQRFSQTFANFCIDTGSEISILDDPKFPKTDSNRLRSYLEFESSFGKEILKTVVEERFELLRTYNMDIHSNQLREINPVCDVILGQDFLSDYLYSINLKEMKILFN